MFHYFLFIQRAFGGVVIVKRMVSGQVDILILGIGILVNKLSYFR